MLIDAAQLSNFFINGVLLISNLPESIAATTALGRAGRDTARIMRFWVLVALGFAVTSLAGYVLLDSASPRTVAFVLAFAGGAVLTMLAITNPIDRIDAVLNRTASAKLMTGACRPGG